MNLYAVADRIVLLLSLLFCWFADIIYKSLKHALGIIMHITHTRSDLSVVCSGFADHGTFHDDDDSHCSVK